MSTAAEHPTYVGREQELGVLNEAIRQADDGRLGVVFVEGEAGIGKSRLLSQALASAEMSGSHTLYGKSEELERTLPFGAIRQLLESEPTAPDNERGRMARTLLDTLVADQPRGVDVRYRIVEDVLNFVENLSTTAPVVIALDDLHWADTPSLLVLSSIGRRLGHLPVLLLGAFRPLPLNDDLASLVGGLTERGATHLRLSP